MMGGQPSEPSLESVFHKIHQGNNERAKYLTGMKKKHSYIQAVMNRPIRLSRKTQASTIVAVDDRIKWARDLKIKEGSEFVGGLLEYEGMSGFGTIWGVVGGCGWSVGVARNLFDGGCVGRHGTKMGMGFIKDDMSGDYDFLVWKGSRQRYPRCRAGLVNGISLLMAVDERIFKRREDVGGGGGSEGGGGGGVNEGRGGRKRERGGGSGREGEEREAERGGKVKGGEVERREEDEWEGGKRGKEGDGRRKGGEERERRGVEGREGGRGRWSEGSGECVDKNMKKVEGVYVGECKRLCRVVTGMGLAVCPTNTDLYMLGIAKRKVSFEVVKYEYGWLLDHGQVIFGLLFLLLKDRLHIEIIKTWATRVVRFTLLVICAMGIREASEVPTPCVALENGECDVSVYEASLADPTVGKKKKIGFATGIIHGLQLDALMMVLRAPRMDGNFAEMPYDVSEMLGNGETPRKRPQEKGKRF
ncbi:hypothetical protein Tco_0794019 [Tanacetum coccineum]